MGFTVLHNILKMIKQTKVCIKCEREKLLNKFYKDKFHKYGCSNICIKCDKIKGAEYRKNNGEKEKARTKIWRDNNKEIKKVYNKIYQEKNKEKIKTHNQENKEKINNQRRKYVNNRRKIDVEYKLKEIIGTQIYKILKTGKAGIRWVDILGYSSKELKEHLQNQFKSGMNWENYGRGGWEIDHIIPVSIFVIRSYKSKGLKKCWALSNLRPMWANENKAKSNKLFV